MFNSLLLTLNAGDEILQGLFLKHFKKYYRKKLADFSTGLM